MPVGICSSRANGACRTAWRVRDYDLTLTLNCGQAFRWTPDGAGWVGVVNGRWVRLSAQNGLLCAETAVPPGGWQWLADYLQVEVNLAAILATFPEDAPLQAARVACRGLRLLRQDPWECLASFLLSSCKAIPQIRAVIARLCARHGEPVVVPAGGAPAWSFPTPQRVAALSESALRQLGAGFRARHLLAAARTVAAGRLDLVGLASLPLPEARERLLGLPGVGPKIADCVLLFGCGFAQAFPVDVWVERALCGLYFAGRRVAARRLREFAAVHFGPYAGYAQQYLFHHVRTRGRDLWGACRRRPGASRLRRSPAIMGHGLRG